MKNSNKKLEFKFERTIPAPPEEVYQAWLDPKVPGNPWHAADKLLLDPRVDGFFYWTFKTIAHYGRFTELEPGVKIVNTWVSPNTLGEESTVTVSFKKQGKGTLLTLVHSDLPDHELALSHQDGWSYFIARFQEQFGAASPEGKAQ